MNNQNLFYNLDKIVSNLELIKKFCSNNKSEQTDEISEKCSQLAELSAFMDKICVEYNFEQVPANGFYTFNRLLSAFTDQLVCQIKSKNKLDPDFIKLIRMIFTYKDWLFDTYEILKSEETGDHKENKPLITKQLLLDSKMFYKVVNSDNDIRHLIFGQFVGFWLSKELQKSYGMLFKFMAFGSRLPCSFSALFNSKKAGELSFRMLTNCSLRQPFDSMHNTEGWFISSFVKTITTFNIHVHSRTIYLPKQDRYRVNYKGHVADFNNISSEEAANFNDEEQQARDSSPGMRYRNSGSTIRCRYSCISSENKIRESLNQIKKDVDIEERFKILKYNSGARLPNGQEPSANNVENTDLINQDKVLVLYIHGGGFFTQGSTSSEMFLRNIVNHLGGVPLLSVDYSLTVPFPIPVQELLDVYLWIFSKKDEVKEKLGFHPEKVVFFGDSAGGKFCVSLVILLNELNNMISKNSSDKNELIKLPYSILCLYPALTMSNMAPSKTFATFELMISFPILLSIVGLYGANVATHKDFKRIEKTKEFQEIVEKNKSVDDDAIKMVDESSAKEINDSTPWYICDYKTFKNYTDYMTKFFKNPIITPCLYDKYEELEQTNLYVMAANEDSMLDDGIELAKKWKGNVRLDVLSNCTHGFMSMKNFSSDHKEATFLLINRLQKACGLI